MHKPMGILVSSFDFSPVAEDEFHDWYDTEHIPERQRVPGFLDCTRWLSIDDPKVSMTTYDLASVDVLRSPGYLAIGYENNSPWTRRVGWRCIKRLRFEGEQVVPGDRLPPADAQGLFVIAVNVDAAFADAFDAWFRDAHLPALLRVPGVACVRRFRATASTHDCVITVHLDRAEVAASPAWRAARGGDWPGQFGSQVRDPVATLCARYRRARD
jgi:hypothetical protein